MKQFYILTLVALMLQCNSYKQAQKNLNAGNFDLVLEKMLKKNEKGIKDKDYTQWVSIAQKAYSKANEVNEININRLNQMGDSSAKYRDLYNNYLILQERQDKIQKLLPIIHNGKEVNFKTADYTSLIQKNKKSYADNLYKEAERKLSGNTKQQAQEAFGLFNQVKGLYPNYPFIQMALDNSYTKGVSQVLVQINNDSQTILPRMLETELKDYSYLAEDMFWYKFDSEEQKTKNYDYIVELNFRNIQVSPESRNSERIIKEKDIVEGWEYAKNPNGSYVTDSLGHKIKIDKHITVRAEINELHQIKESFITADVVLYDTQKVLKKFPIESSFLFEDFSANIRGDRRAIDAQYLQNTKDRPLPFPTSEQMVYDCGQDLKLKLRQIIADIF